jgi:formate hydrogenlyase subunit 3/multisubunit Na+/H+ antiporter MnhD subunit
MYLRLRNLLPFLVACLWLVLSWWLILGAPPLEGLSAALMLHDGVHSGLEASTWLAAMILAMILADRLYVGWVRRRAGVDPMKLHWSKLRNRDGAFLCAACQSVFLLPPEDFSDSGWVHCGDCGHAVAPYGEMKLYLPAHCPPR